MVKFKVAFFFLLYLGLFSACEREYEVDLEDYEQQNFAVFSLFTPNGVFNDEQIFSVEVSTTKSILDNSVNELIDDAVVTIATSPIDNPGQRSEESLQSRITDNKNVAYFSDLIPQDGFEYELLVEHPDYPTAYAKSVVPSITEISEINLSEFKTSNENLFLDTDLRYFTTAEIVINNNELRENHFHLLVWLELESGWVPINIDQDLLQETLGTEATIVNFEDSRVFFGAHFNNASFTEENQKLNFDISFILREFNNPSTIKVELRSVSKDYNKYFVDGFRLSQSGSNSFLDGSENISNNVEGGFGVFAGYSSYDVDIPFRR